MLSSRRGKYVCVFLGCGTGSAIFLLFSQEVLESKLNTNLYWEQNKQTVASLLAGCKTRRCCCAEVSLFHNTHTQHPLFSTLVLFFTLNLSHLLLTLSSLFVYLSACYSSLRCLSLGPRSVTGEFPELITGGYPRVQRGPAHLQAEGAREGCLITFSSA